MRQPELKPEYKDTWHHCYNRAAGTAADRPMDDADRKAFVRILHRVCQLYTVEVVALPTSLKLRGPMTATGRRQVTPDRGLGFPSPAASSESHPGTVSNSSSATALE